MECQPLQVRGFMNLLDHSELPSSDKTSWQVTGTFETLVIPLPMSESARVLSPWTIFLGASFTWKFRGCGEHIATLRSMRLPRTPSTTCLPSNRVRRSRLRFKTDPETEVNCLAEQARGSVY